MFVQLLHRRVAVGHSQMHTHMNYHGATHIAPDTCCLRSSDMQHARSHAACEAPTGDVHHTGPSVGQRTPAVNLKLQKQTRSSPHSRRFVGDGFQCVPSVGWKLPGICSVACRSVAPTQPPPSYIRCRSPLRSRCRRSSQSYKLARAYRSIFVLASLICSTCR